MPAHRRERRLAPLPHHRAFLFSLRHADLARPIFTAYRADLRDQCVDFRHRSIELHQKKPAAVGIVRMHRSFGRLNRQIIHHLDGCRQHARRNDIAHRRAGFVGSFERRQQRLHAFRLLHDAQRHLGRDPQRAFRAHKHARQIVPRRVQRLRSEMRQRPVRQHHVHGQNVGSSESVFQTVRAARVLRHIAADAAHRL